MARLDKIIQHYKEQLKEKNIKNIPEFIQSILNSDITKGKYSRFLLDCYLNDKFRVEDLKGGLESTIGIAITLFHKHKNKLPEDQRSIYNYDSPGNLWNAVKQFEGELSGKEMKKELQDKIYSETEFVYEDVDTGLKIISPLTEDAAKWWGRGTRWCTSAEKNNMFLNYVKDAPLLIFLMPDGEKLQLWKHENDIQFMNEADNDVDLKYIEENWNILEPVCLWLKSIKFIPYLDENIILNLIDFSSDVITLLPSKEITEKVLLKSLSNSFYSSEGLNHIITEDNLKNIKIDEDFLYKVIDANIYYLVVFKEYLDDNKKNLHNINWNNVILAAIKKDGNFLQNIDIFFKDIKCDLNQLYHEAVEQNGDAIYYVPTEKWTKDLLLKAIKSNYKSYYFISDYQENFFTNEDITNLIKDYPNIIPYINPNKILDDQIKMIVEICPNFILEIPEEKKTREICDIVFDKEPKLFHKFPSEYKEHCLLNDFNKYKPYAKLLDYPLDSLLFTQYQNDSQKSIPLIKSKEFWLDMLKKDSYYLNNVPKELLNLYFNDFVKSAFLDNADDLEYIYESGIITSKNIPLEICNFILEKNKKLLYLLPEKYHTKENIIETLKLFPEEMDAFIGHNDFKEIWQEIKMPKLSQQLQEIISQINFNSVKSIKLNI